MVVGLGDALGLNSQAMQFFLAVKADERVLARGGFEIFHLDLVDLFGA